MENGPPEANFEVQYYSGDKFILSAAKGTWTSASPCWPEASLHPDFRSWHVERDRIRHLERMMEDLERDEEANRMPGKRFVRLKHFLSIRSRKHFA
jgi:hypothetical protein